MIIYFVGFVLLLIAIGCIQDVLLKLHILNSGIECFAQIEQFKESRTRTTGSDIIQYRAVLKYIDLNGMEHKIISTKLYEKWETECLLGREVPIRYYRKDPEKVVMEKRELVRPVMILAIILLLPILYILANAFILDRFLRSLMSII